MLSYLYILRNNRNSYHKVSKDFLTVVKDPSLYKISYITSFYTAFIFSAVVWDGQNDYSEF